MTVDAAPLRLLMRGNVESWNLQAVEDLRELPLSQWHEPLNLEDDWLAAVFGKDPADQAQASSSASCARPAIKDKVDSDDDDKSDGRQVAIAGQELEQLQPQEHDEENPDGPAMPCRTSRKSQADL